MKLSYELESGAFNVGIDQAFFKTDKAKVDNLLSISGNFHHIVSAEIGRSYEKVIAIVDNVDSDLDRYLSFCKLLPEI